MKTVTRQRFEIILCGVLSMAIGVALGYNFGVESTFAYVRATIGQ